MNRPKRIHAAPQRIFIGTLDARLIALDARNGAPCRRLSGSNGSVDLAAGARLTERGQYLVTIATGRLSRPDHHGLGDW